MTINKNQGPSLNYVGLYLPRPVFSCRGDFRIPSYWFSVDLQILTHHRAFIFSKEREKVRINPIFLEIKGSGVGYVKGMY